MYVSAYTVKVSNCQEKLVEVSTISAKNEKPPQKMKVKLKFVKGKKNKNKKNKLLNSPINPIIPLLPRSTGIEAFAGLLSYQNWVHAFLSLALITLNLNPTQHSLIVTPAFPFSTSRLCQRARACFRHLHCFQRKHGGSGKQKEVGCCSLECTQLFGAAVGLDDG